MRKIVFVVMVFVSLLFGNNMCKNRLFSFTITSSSSSITLDNLLQEIAVNTCGINVIYSDDLTKQKVKQIKIDGIVVKDYTFKQLLNLLITKNNLFYDIKNNTLDISYIKTKTFNIDYIPSTRKGSATFSASSAENSGDSNSVDTQYEFDFWGGLSNNLISILNSNSEYKAPLPIIDKNSGLVTITGTYKQLQRVKEYIDKLNNRLHKQILIDVRIYEVELSSSHVTGVDWSQMQLSLPSQSVKLNGRNFWGPGSVFNSTTFNISGLLNFLATQGNVNSISNPKIATLNNQKAIISVGDTINYKYPSKVITTPTNTGSQVDTEYTYGSKFVGILLDITPEISNNGDIILRMNPTISSFRDTTQLTDPNRDLAPDTSENKMSTVVRIKDGDTLVLGGLITNRNAFRENGVPILKEIPVVKYLFSSTSKISEKRELIFVVTPHILDRSKKVTIKDLGF